MSILQDPVLSKIFIYPIKSLAGIELDHALISNDGIMHPHNQNVIDRLKWMIVDSKRSFLSQRKLPKMTLIKPKVDHEHIVLSMPGKTEAKFLINYRGEMVKCRLWSDYLDCYSYGIDSEVSKWLSDALGCENLDLVCLMKLTARRDGDFSTFMVLSEASLHDLNSRLAKKVSIVNFRANLVVKKCSSYAEDNWRKFVISQVSFVKTKNCIRCVMTTVDPLNGEKSRDQEPLKTLKAYRLNKDLYGTSPMFGMYYELENLSEPQMISKGDAILVSY
ncbi:oxidoreductase [Brachionus plicatilis]|uniref:Oxidoreductase n=1 Tax=Brachionus plicatilis TaxID=10195 RepID=A0A3M7PJD8_BRAPC|nr:oxidoreductase [Brachionus plicatilis]